MDLRSVLIPNGTGLFMLVMLLYVSRTKVLRRRTEDRVFLVMILGVLIACVAEALSYAIDGRLFTGALFLNYTLNTYLYLVNSLLAFCVLVYFDLILYDDPERIRKNYKPQIAVAAAMVILDIVNLFVPVIYSISDGNVYSRLPFSYIYYAVIVYFTVSAWLTTRRYEKENGIRSFLNVSAFIIPIIIGAGVQFMAYGLSLGWLAAAVGLTSLYMMQQNETAYIDPISDVYNRQYMNNLIASWTSGGHKIAGIMLDIDRFKSINDAFGHVEGDGVIKTLAMLLMKARSGSEQVFRFAGDEFIILKKADSVEQLDPYISRMIGEINTYNKVSGKDYTISVSYGSAVFDPLETDLDGFMKKMDDRMYEMKSLHHSQDGGPA